MPDAALAGLPRLVRVRDEIRWRGQAALALGLAAAAYWTAGWLLDQPLEGWATLAAGVVAATLTGGFSMVASAGRLRDGLRRTLPPPSLSVYETHADGKERRTRFTGIVLLGAVVLLVFDKVTDGGGVMAGLLAGLFAAWGVVDVMEARRWRQAERHRHARLYLMVRPNALVARLGAMDVYEVPRTDVPRDLDPVGTGRFS